MTTMTLTGVRLEHRGWVTRLVRRILGVPLVAKLIGANVIIVASAFVVQTTAFGGMNNSEILTAVLGLATASVVNFFLVRLALQPIEELEDLADRVSDGEFDVRGEPSPYADKDLSRLGATVNCLLDSLAAERRRIQALGAEVVRAHDVERASVSRELHDSIAQTLAAVRFQLAAAGHEVELGEMKNRLSAVNAMISATMEEVVHVSYSLHSRVAEELGLEAALGMLGRQIENRCGTAVELSVAAIPSCIPSNVAATLFRVAEEALKDMEMHGRAKWARVSVSSRDGMVRIEVTHDAEHAVRAEPLGTGLASVKDRVLLAGGKMRIETVVNGGTRVSAELRTEKTAS